MKEKTKTIRLKESVKQELDRLKIAEGETYEGVIKRIINYKGGKS
jgi:predicted CopG family antitoxin